MADNPESASDPTSLLRSILEREKRLKELKELPDPGKHASKIDDLLAKIRKGYRVLITEHSHVITSEKRDLDGLMWKNCFYRPIEEFRKKLRANASILESMEEKMRRSNVPLRSGSSSSISNGSNADSKSRDDHADAQRDLVAFREKLSAQRLFMARLDRDFSAFLTKGVIFYQSMISQVSYPCD